MYALGYNRLFLGMLFITFDINLGRINVLPNFIGYILFYSGLSILSEQNKIFEKGKFISALLVILTAKDIIKSQSNTLTGQLMAGNFASMIIGTVAMALNMYLIYIVCRGIYMLCEERGLEELKENTKYYGKIYFIVTFIWMFYLPFSINMSRDSSGLMILGGIISTVASITIAVLFRRAKMELGEIDT